MFCLGAALFGGMILLPLYWQQVRHESVLVTGLLTAPQGLGHGADDAARRQADRSLRRRPAGPVRSDPDHGGHGSVRADRRPHLDRLACRWRCSSAASGIGFAFMPAMAAAFASLERSELPDATPQLNVLQRVGGSIGTAVLAVVLQRALVGAHTLCGAAAAYGTAFWVVGRADRPGDHPLRSLLTARRATGPRLAQRPSRRPSAGRRWPRRSRHDRDAGPASRPPTPAAPAAARTRSPRWAARSRGDGRRAAAARTRDPAPGRASATPSTACCSGSRDAARAVGRRARRASPTCPRPRSTADARRPRGRRSGRPHALRAGPARRADVADRARPRAGRGAPGPVRAAVARGAGRVRRRASCAPPPRCWIALRAMFDEIAREPEAFARQASARARRGAAAALGVAHPEADLARLPGLAEVTVAGSRIGRLNATSTVNAPGSCGPSAARQRALVHIPWAIAEGKPNSRAVSGWTWIGLRSPDTAP